eukprot:1327495-Amorphochlora_amoeboformis.AAC.3
MGGGVGSKLMDEFMLSPVDHAGRISFQDLNEVGVDLVQTARVVQLRRRVRGISYLTMLAIYPRTTRLK